MIKNIIFDIGGVLLEYRWRDMLLDYGASEEEALAINKITFSDPTWRAMDRGDVTLAEARDYFVKTYPDYSDYLQFFLTRTDLMDVDRPKVWEKMKACKDAGYGIYILSNYGKELFDQHAACKEFMQYPDGMVISYEIRSCKPERPIYDTLADRYNLVREESIFFDDMEENVTAAIEYGFHSVQITSQQVILDELDKLLEAKR